MKKASVDLEFGAPCILQNKHFSLVLYAIDVIFNLDAKKNLAAPRLCNDPIDPEPPFNTKQLRVRFNFATCL